MQPMLLEPSASFSNLREPKSRILRRSDLVVVERRSGDDTSSPGTTYYYVLLPSCPLIIVFYTIRYNT